MEKNVSGLCVQNTGFKSFALVGICDGVKRSLENINKIGLSFLFGVCYNIRNNAITMTMHKHGRMSYNTF